MNCCGGRRAHGALRGGRHADMQTAGTRPCLASCASTFSRPSATARQLPLTRTCNRLHLQTHASPPPHPVSPRDAGLVTPLHAEVLTRPPNLMDRDLEATARAVAPRPLGPHRGLAYPRGTACHAATKGLQRRPEHVLPPSPAETNPARPPGDAELGTALPPAQAALRCGSAEHTLAPRTTPRSARPAREGPADATRPSCQRSLTEPRTRQLWPPGPTRSQHPRQAAPPPRTRGTTPTRVAMPAVVVPSSLSTPDPEAPRSPAHLFAAGVTRPPRLAGHPAAGDWTAPAPPLARPPASPAF